MPEFSEGNVEMDNIHAFAKKIYRQVFLSLGCDPQETRRIVEVLSSLQGEFIGIAVEFLGPGIEEKQDLWGRFFEYLLEHLDEVADEVASDLQAEIDSNSEGYGDINVGFTRVIGNT